jgi:sugar phosphate isomerase/epimerase
MVRLSMNEITTFSWTFDEDVHRYQAAGYDGIGVWRPKLADFGEERGVELLAESGLQVSNLLWAGGFTGSEGRSFRDSVDDAVEAVHLAAAMQADCLVVYSGPRAGHTLNHARRLTRRALKELAPVAAACGVTVAVEPVHEACDGEWSFLHSITDTLEFLESIGAPAVKFVFDTYHLGQGFLSWEQIRVFAPRVAVVHLADARHLPRGEQNRCLIGSGVIPIRELIATLTAGGFQGFFDIELTGEDVEGLEYDEILRQSRTALTELIGT